MFSLLFRAFTVFLKKILFRNSDFYIITTDFSWAKRVKVGSGYIPTSKSKIFFYFFFVQVKQQLSTKTLRLQHFLLFQVKDVLQQKLAATACPALPKLTPPRVHGNRASIRARQGELVVTCAKLSSIGSFTIKPPTDFDTMLYRGCL